MDFEDARQKALQFRRERDWEQFHNPKDLAISISLEAAELLECFQWSGDRTAVPERRCQMQDELADVLIYSVYMAEELSISIPDAMSAKIDQNAAKYPVEKARGSSKKYTEL